MEKKPDLVLSFLCFGVAFQCRELDEIQARVGRYMKFDQTQSDFVRYQTDRGVVVIKFASPVIYVCCTFCRLHLPSVELSRLIKHIRIQRLVELLLVIRISLIYIVLIRKLA